MKLFTNQFEKVHFHTLVGFVVGFSSLTFWWLIHQSAGDWSQNWNFTATLLTVSGPFTGAIARPHETSCFRNSLLLLPYCLAFLSVGILAQFVALPFRWGAQCLRTALWVIGLLGWFAGAALSLAHALS